MSSLLELIIGVLLFWRLALCFFGSLILAIVLSKVVSSFDAAFALMLVILASTFGIYWHARADSGFGVFEKLPPEIIASSKTSAPVAFLGFVFVGFLWSAVFLQVNDSVALSALALLFCSVPVVAWHRWVLGNPMSWWYVAFSYSSVLIGFVLSVTFLKVSDGF